MTWPMDGQMTLGALIDALEAIHCKEGHSGVFTDFCGLAPTGRVYSYRGDYSHFAIEVGREYDFPSKCSLPGLIEVLKGSVGKTFEGWKGGDYTMKRDTPVWVTLAPDECFGTFVSGVKDEVYMVVIETKYGVS